MISESDVKTLSALVVEARKQRGVSRDFFAGGHNIKGLAEDDAREYVELFEGDERDGWVRAADVLRIVEARDAMADERSVKIIEALQQRDLVSAVEETADLATLEMISTGPARWHTLDGKLRELPIKQRVKS